MLTGELQGEGNGLEEVATVRRGRAGSGRSGLREAAGAVDPAVAGSGDADPARRSRTERFGREAVRRGGGRSDERRRGATGATMWAGSGAGAPIQTGSREMGGSGDRVPVRVRFRWR